MKTSFYFFLWIIVYPILGLLHNPWIYQNSFIVALIAVFGFSWILNNAMPHTLQYGRIAEMASILEEVYTGDVKSFMKRLQQMETIELITSIYFVVTLLFIVFTMVKGNANDWISILVFGYFAYGAISRTIKLMKANNNLKNNPTPSECVSAVENVYQIDYNSYYEERLYHTAEGMLPEKPKYFTLLQVISVVISIICSLFGLFYLIVAIIILVENHSSEAISAGLMYFLYGSLAAYFGIKDSVSCIAYFKRNRKSQAIEAKV